MALLKIKNKNKTAVQVNARLLKFFTNCICVVKPSFRIDG